MRDERQKYGRKLLALLIPATLLYDGPYIYEMRGCDRGPSDVHERQGGDARRTVP